MRFSEYVDVWKRAARGRNSKSWSMTQDQVLSAHILPILGHLKLAEIKPHHISDVLESSRSKSHKPNTTKKIYMVLSKVFSDAVDFFDYIGKSPVKRKFHLPYVPPVKRPYIGWIQALIVLEYCMGDDHYGPPIWIMLLVGLRISEVEALEWSDIDFKRDEVVICKSYCVWSKQERPYTKNKNPYAVPLPPLLRAYLWNRRKLSGKVCLSPEGKMLSRWSLRSYLSRLQEKLMLTIRSSHGLRHSCARIYVEKGARDEEIKELLGHKWLQSSKTYTHREDLNTLKNISKKLA